MLLTRWNQSGVAGRDVEGGRSWRTPWGHSCFPVPVARAVCEKRGRRWRSAAAGRTICATAGRRSNSSLGRTVEGKATDSRRRGGTAVRATGCAASAPTRGGKAGRRPGGRGTAPPRRRVSPGGTRWDPRPAVRSPGVVAVERFLAVRAHRREARRRWRKRRSGALPASRIADRYASAAGRTSPSRRSRSARTAWNTW